MGAERALLGFGERRAAVAAAVAGSPSPKVVRSAVWISTVRQPRSWVPAWSRTSMRRIIRVLWILIPGIISRYAGHLLLASDLHLLNPTDYTALAQQTTKVKRMLTGLLQKLTAER